MLAREKIKIEDRSGCIINITQYIYLDAYTSELEGREAKGRSIIAAEEYFDDDVLLVAYARSGSHWATEIVNMLMLGKIEYDNFSLYPRSIELRRMAPIPENFNEVRPRLLHSHAPFFMLPEKLHKLKMIFVYRNPKDVAYSLYKLVCAASEFGYDGRFEDFMHLFLEGRVPHGDYFRFINSWEKFLKENHKCCISYEELSNDPMYVTQKIADYLNIKREKSLMKDIVENCTIDKMKKYTTLSIRTFKDGHDGFLRKGVAGDWKNHFTVAMSEEFDKVFARKLPDTELKFQF